MKPRFVIELVPGRYWLSSAIATRPATRLTDAASYRDRHGAKVARGMSPFRRLYPGAAIRELRPGSTK